MKRIYLSLTRRRFWFGVHRFTGTLVAVFVVVIASTGLLLNHTVALQLDKRHVESDTVLDHYGIRAPTQIPVYAVQSHWVSQWDRLIYFDTRIIGTGNNELRGAVEAGVYLAVATRDELWLFTSSGELIERMGATHGVPLPIERIGTHDNMLVVASAKGVFRADLDILNWRSHTSTTRWSDASTLPAILYEAGVTNYRRQQLSWERLIQDVHSGRVFGNAGVYMMDVAAILLLLLAITGLGLSVTRPGKRRRHHKHHHEPT